MTSFPAQNVPGRRRSRGATRFVAHGLEPRLLLVTISGVVFDDLDADGAEDRLEPGLAGWTVFVDTNEDGSLGAAEPRDATDAAGAYSISGDGIRTGVVRVRQVPQGGRRLTAPVDGEHALLVGRIGDVFTGVDFGVTRRALVTGTVFHDANDDGAWDRGEAALAGRTVFADADADGLLDAGEASDVTDAVGDYALSPAAGAYTVRQVQQAGWWQTHPAPAGTGHAVTVADAQILSNRDFGNVVATYDLLGAGFAVTSAFAPVPADGRIDALYQVRNTGTADTPGFRVAFYLSDDASITTSDIFLRSIAQGGIPRHSTVDRTTSLTLPRPDPLRTDNQYWVGMIIDSDNDVAETSEANNSNQELLADRYPVSSEGDLPLPVDDANVVARPIAFGTPVSSVIGDEWIGGYDHDVYRFTGQRGHRIFMHFRALEQGLLMRLYDAAWSLVESHEVALRVHLPADGTYYVVVSSDDNRASNPRRFAGRVEGPTLPYTLRILNVTPDFAGQLLNVTGFAPGPLQVLMRIANRASLVNDEFDVGLYLSDDNQIARGDRRLATIRVTPGDRDVTDYVVRAEVVLPDPDPFLSDNQYWIGMIIDSANEVVEWDETNNANLGPPADMFPVRSELDIAMPADGQNIGRLRQIATEPFEAVIGDEWVGAHDQDIYRIDVDPGEVYRFDVDRTGGNLDAYLRVYDSEWNLLAASDNDAAPGETVGTDPYAVAQFPIERWGWAVVSARGNHTNHPLRLTGRSAAGTGSYTISATNVTPAVTGRRVFYNNSAFDGRDPAATAADDGAIAPGKAPLLPGQAARFANVTSYTRGINGVMVDVLNPLRPPAASDFAFGVAAGGDPTAWVDAPAPSVTVRPLAEPAVSRVTFTWPDESITNAWLRVTLRPGGNVGLIAPDVFVFGNLVGETGDPAGAPGLAVTSGDLLAVRRGLFSGGVAGIGHAADFNRDGRVDARDLVAVRTNLGRTLAPPQVPPAAAAFPGAPPPASSATSILTEEGSAP